MIMLLDYLTPFTTIEKTKKTLKKCVICRAKFKPRSNAKTADTRTLCAKCRKSTKK